MSRVIIYLLEVSVVSLILYGLYWLLLRKETFFVFNRFFLLAILPFSFLFPWLSFDLLPFPESVVDKPIGELRNVRVAYYDALTEWTYQSSRSPVVDENTGGLSASGNSSPQPSLLTVIFAIYGIGFTVVVFRLIGLLWYIRKLKYLGQQEIIDGLTVVKFSRTMAPFSFLNTVFVPYNLVRNEDFRQILAHEKTHIREGHSYDLLFVQLLAAGQWFNPVVWQLIKSLKTTHEYIADKNTINQGYSLVTYQTLLLKQLISTNSYGLIHNFNLTFIKKRITMMNTEQSGWTGKVKVAFSLFAAVAISLLIIQCNSKLDEQVLQTPTTSAEVEVDSGIDVPVLPETRFKMKDHAATLNLAIDNNEIRVNGEVVTLDDLTSALEDRSEEKTIMVLKIDRAQPMSYVRKVQREMRRASRMKVLYIGRTQEGQRSEVPILLPPHPENNSGTRVPAVDDEYARQHNLSLLKIVMNESSGPEQQQIVYNFAKEQVAQQKTNYVVSARYSDDDTYGKYVESIYHIQEAFHQLYKERAQDLYGESYWDIREQMATNEKYDKMYSTIKKQAPMAISIAED